MSDTAPATAPPPSTDLKGAYAQLKDPAVSAKEKRALCEAIAGEEGRLEEEFRRLREQGGGAGGPDPRQAAASRHRDLRDGNAPWRVLLEALRDRPAAGKLLREALGQADGAAERCVAMAAALLPHEAFQPHRVVDDDELSSWFRILDTAGETGEDGRRFLLFFLHDPDPKVWNAAARAVGACAARDRELYPRLRDHEAAFAERGYVARASSGPPAPARVPDRALRHLFAAYLSFLGTLGGREGKDGFLAPDDLSETTRARLGAPVLDVVAAKGAPEVRCAACLVALPRVWGRTEHAEANLAAARALLEHAGSWGCLTLADVLEQSIGDPAKADPVAAAWAAHLVPAALSTLGKLLSPSRAHGLPNSIHALSRLLEEVCRTCRAWDEEQKGRVQEALAALAVEARDLDHLVGPLVLRAALAMAKRDRLAPALAEWVRGWLPARVAAQADAPGRSPEERFSSIASQAEVLGAGSAALERLRECGVAVPSHPPRPGGPLPHAVQVGCSLLLVEDLGAMARPDAWRLLPVRERGARVWRVIETYRTWRDAPPIEVALRAAGVPIPDRWPVPPDLAGVERVALAVLLVVQGLEGDAEGRDLDAVAFLVRLVFQGEPAELDVFLPFLSDGNASWWDDLLARRLCAYFQGRFRASARYDVFPDLYRLLARTRSRALWVESESRTGLAGYAEGRLPALEAVCRVVARHLPSRGAAAAGEDLLPQVASLYTDLRDARYPNSGSDWVTPGRSPFFRGLEKLRGSLDALGATPVGSVNRLAPALSKVLGLAEWDRMRPALREVLSDLPAGTGTGVRRARELAKYLPEGDGTLFWLLLILVALPLDGPGELDPSDGNAPATPGELPEKVCGGIEAVDRLFLDLAERMARLELSCAAIVECRIDEGESLSRHAQAAEAEIEGIQEALLERLPYPERAVLESFLSRSRQELRRLSVAFSRLSARTREAGAQSGEGLVDALRDAATAAVSEFRGLDPDGTVRRSVIRWALDRAMSAGSVGAVRGLIESGPGAASADGLRVRSDSQLEDLRRRVRGWLLDRMEFDAAALLARGEDAWSMAGKGRWGTLLADRVLHFGPQWIGILIAATALMDLGDKLNELATRRRVVEMLCLGLPALGLSLVYLVVTLEVRRREWGIRPVRECLRRGARYVFPHFLRLMGMAYLTCALLLTLLHSTSAAQATDPAIPPIPMWGVWLYQAPFWMSLALFGGIVATDVVDRMSRK